MRRKFGTCSSVSRWFFQWSARSQADGHSSRSLEGYAKHRIPTSANSSSCGKECCSLMASLDGSLRLFDFPFRSGLIVHHRPRDLRGSAPCETVVEGYHQCTPNRNGRVVGERLNTNMLRAKSQKKESVACNKRNTAGMDSERGWLWRGRTERFFILFVAQGKGNGLVEKMTVQIIAAEGCGKPEEEASL